ncbi:MAG TPA: WD40 repeat domain-containing protein [Candidatus Binatia bacterium]|nr:WD40 repeat domain-containing protein [Candidatus Binatia bacterium]
MSRRGRLTRSRIGLTQLWSADLGDYARAVAWSPEAHRVAVGVAGGPVHVLDATNGGEVGRLPGHAPGTLVLDWSKAALATGGEDGSVRLWDPARPCPLRTVDGGGQWVERLRWSQDGTRLASAAGRCLRIWDGDGDLAEEMTCAQTIQDLDWRRQPSELAAAFYGGIRIWRVGGDGGPRDLRWQGASLRCAWSPNGAYLATGDQDASIHLWLVSRGTDLVAEGYATKVRHLSWDASSRFLASAGGAEVLVWDCSGRGPAGTSPRVLDRHRANVSALSFQHRGQRIASADGRGGLVVWAPLADPRTSGGLDLAEPITALAWAADDGRLLVAGAAGTGTLVEVAVAEDGRPV